MKKRLRVLLVVLACCIGLAGVGRFALDGLVTRMCGNEVFQEALAPRGNLKAVLFQRDCGATTGFSTQISLVSISDELPNASGNVFIVEGHPKDRDIEMTWLNPRELLIRHTAGLQANKQETLLNGVTITYE
jgi:hypothetical protein